MKFYKWQIIATLAILVLTATFFHFAFNGYSLSQEIKKPFSASQPLYESCVTAMQNQTCAVMMGPETDSLPYNVDKILIAGLGEISVSDYKFLKNQGIYMCQTIKDACDRNFSEAYCRIAQVMYE